MTPIGTRPLRVAMVTASALPRMGGIETHVHEVSTRLAAAGVDVTVLTTDPSGELPREETASRLPGSPVARLSPLARLLSGPWIGAASAAGRRLRRHPYTGCAQPGGPHGAGGSAASRLSRLC